MGIIEPVYDEVRHGHVYCAAPRWALISASGNRRGAKHQRHATAHQAGKVLGRDWATYEEAVCRAVRHSGAMALVVRGRSAFSASCIAP